MELKLVTPSFFHCLSGAAMMGFSLDWGLLLAIDLPAMSSMGNARAEHLEKAAPGLQCYEGSFVCWWFWLQPSLDVYRGVPATPILATPEGGTLSKSEAHWPKT